MHILNSLHPPWVGTHIPHTVFNTFPKVLMRKMCLTIKCLFSWWSFPLFYDGDVWWPRQKNGPGSSTLRVKHAADHSTMLLSCLPKWVHIIFAIKYCYMYTVDTHTTLFSEDILCIYLYIPNQCSSGDFFRRNGRMNFLLLLSWSQDSYEKKKMMTSQKVNRNPK